MKQVKILLITNRTTYSSLFFATVCSPVNAKPLKNTVIHIV